MYNLSKKLLKISLLVITSISCKKNDVNVNRRICVECKISENGQTTRSESHCGAEADVFKFRMDFYMRYAYHFGEKECKER
jgi:hypothetical protein